MKTLESKLQASCVEWFDYAYPKYRQLLFAIPNGGARNVITGAMLKRQGVRKGAPDMFFAKSSDRKGALMPHKGQPFKIIYEFYNGLFIEFKAGKGKLTPEQMDFFSIAKENGYKCEVVTSFDQFKGLIENYLL